MQRGNFSKTNKRVSFKRLAILLLVIFLFIFIFFYITYNGLGFFSIIKTNQNLNNINIINSSSTLVSSSSVKGFSKNNSSSSVYSSSTINYVNTPEIVRGIYMSSYAASSQTFRNDLIKFLDETSLNTIIIDVKDNDGALI
jgi:hypothetical protein